MQQQTISTGNAYQLLPKEFSTVISKTTKGEIIREKYGHHVLITKEPLPDGFWVIDVHRVFCKQCSQLQKLSEHKRFYIFFGNRVAITHTCKFCNHTSEYKFQ